MKLRGKPSGFSRLLIYAWMGLLVGSGLLVVTETSAQRSRSGRGSVKHSSKGAGMSAGRGSITVRSGSDASELSNRRVSAAASAGATV